MDCRGRYTALFMAGLNCNACQRTIAESIGIEIARVRSNVRRFQAESFAVWRCPACRSIHARDEVDLDHYYRHYPFHGQQPSRIASLFYERILRRLQRAGLRRTDTVLDHGCGGGLFVEHLLARGYGKVCG